MPFDSMLFLNPASADPLERAAADERAFVSALKRIKATLDTNAGSPNSGELWDADARTWTGEPTIGAEAAATWRREGVQLIGGCCRVGPDLIASMRQAL